MDYLTLRELTYLIKSTIDLTLPDEYWVTGEVSQINCHLRQISVNFRNLTGKELQAGMKILMLARVTYHEVHGLSLNIRDIDPRYTLGEMALKRKEIIEKLKKEGIIDRNRSLPLPPVLQNIAVISSATAAGYGDFINRLDNNPYGYKFSHKLFQSYVQGERAEESLLNALKQCKRLRNYLDAVVIIRGGGSAFDLQCFDTYLLAKEIALFPLPVLTGIGHERDETVADRVANKRLITTTAVAEFFISRAKEFEDNIDTLRHQLVIRTNSLLDREKQTLRSFAEGLSSYTKHYLTGISHRLRNNISLLHSHALTALRTPAINLKEYEGRLESAVAVVVRNNYQNLKDFTKVLQEHVNHILKMQLTTLEHLGSTIKYLDPLNVLKRGYSITYLNGKVLRDIIAVKKADIIDTRLHDGTITSTVESIEEDKK